jgi:hypothetical protein
VRESSHMTEAKDDNKNNSSSDYPMVIAPVKIRNYKMIVKPSLIEKEQKDKTSLLHKLKIS